jgi:DNA-binding NarL/FixJ family response regulator
LLDEVEQEPGSTQRAATSRGRETSLLISPRERDVLALVVEGRSNKDIAEALYVSPNTVKTHVASLLNKLSANTRSQLAAIALRQGLA